MRIQFVNPLLGGDFSTLDIGVTVLATYLNERTDHEASIVDLTFNRRKWQQYLTLKIKSFKPDVIGMSCNTLYLEYIKEIAQFIKENFGLPVVLGGYHASVHPSSTIKIANVDAVFIGDAEYTLPQYLDRLASGQSMEGLKGLWAKDKNGIVKNGIGTFIKNIDDLPVPNWDLWENLDRYFYYLGMLYMIGSRGCPYLCTYCDAHQISGAVEGNYYRIRNPETYANEINLQWDKYRHRGMRLAQMFDQIPTVNGKWLKRFCDEYVKSGKADEQKYSMYSRVDHLNEEKIKNLAKGGCALVRMGVEAGNDFVRNKIYGKGISKEQIRKVFKLCKEYGIGITSYYIVGGPSENRTTINETINLAKELQANRSAFFVFKPFTREGEVLLEKYGGSIDQDRWKQADNITYDAVVRLKDLSPKQVEWLQTKGYFMTFSRRLLGLMGEGPKYFTRLATYISKGIKDGLDLNYLLPYYHIYGYDYVGR